MMMEPGRAGLTEVPGQIIGSLQSQPILLVIVLMNILTIGSILWFGTDIAKGRTEIITKLIDRCGTGPERRDMELKEVPHVTPRALDIKKEE